MWIFSGVSKQFACLFTHCGLSLVLNPSWVCQSCYRQDGRMVNKEHVGTHLGVPGSRWKASRRGDRPCPAGCTPAPCQTTAACPPPQTCSLPCYRCVAGWSLSKGMTWKPFRIQQYLGKIHICCLHIHNTDSLFILQLIYFLKFYLYSFHLLINLQLIVTLLHCKGNFEWWMLCKDSICYLTYQPACGCTWRPHTGPACWGLGGRGLWTWPPGSGTYRCWTLPTDRCWSHQSSTLATLQQQIRMGKSAISGHFGFKNFFARQLVQKYNIAYYISVVMV